MYCKSAPLGIYYCGKHTELCWALEMNKKEVILISMLNVGQVDYIVTPTKTITCEGEKQRPTGIQWSKVTPKMLKEIPVLKDLREKERRLGRDVTLRE